MSQEKLTEIYKYLQSYIKQKAAHKEFIDYYELYDLNKNMSVEEIKKQLKSKRIRILFHPDQLAFIEDDFKQAFIEHSEEIKNVDNVFSNDSTKSKYDNELENAKIRNVQNNNNSQQSINYTEKDLEIAIETTVNKNGFYSGFTGLQSMCANGDASWITRQNNARNRVLGLGKEKIREIIYRKRKDIMDGSSKNMIMDYYSDIINKNGLKQQADTFYHACLYTALKYDVHNNRHQLDFAIKQFIDERNDGAFTNELNSRENLRNSNIKHGDAYILMMSKIHSKREENEEYSYENMSQKPLDEQIAVFSEIMKQEALAYSQAMAM